MGDPVTTEWNAREGRTSGTHARGSAPPPDKTPSWSGTDAGPVAGLDARRAADREEHLNDVMRMRKAATIGLIAWPVFGVVDWIVATWIAPGALWYFWTLRAIGLVLIVPALVIVHRKPPPARLLLRVLDVAIYMAAAILVTLSCLAFRGIASPYAVGITTILVVRSATMADHWRRGILPIALTAISHPLVLLACAPFSVLVRQQLGDPVAVATFVHNVFFIFGSAAIMVVGGHAVWTLRRQVFEARTIGRYRLKRRIGSGGMGEVWRAYHHGLKRDVALKILKRDASLGARTVERFEREVRATTELTHPNTVRIFDYGVTDDGLWFYAMELLEGEDLATLVKREGPLEADRAVFLVWQAARALAEAHLRGIVHRDIKPANIFVTTLGGEPDFVKLLDFGVAKVVDEDMPQTNLTTEGWAVGTPAYIAPEIIAMKPADTRSDVYALGAVLYFTLTGRPPFEGPDMRSVLLAHLKQAPVRPSTRIGRALPGALEGVVLRCLQKKPEQRFEHAGDLSDALSAFLPISR